MGKMIHTVLGEIPPEKLGFTQCHEHLMLSRGKSYEINPALCIDNLEKSVEEAADYREAGGRGIVEAQPVGCNRDCQGLESIARKTGLHIVASTGFHKLQFYPENHWIYALGEQELARLYISELLEGMYQGLDCQWKPVRQKAKAGIIKTALDSCNLEGTYEVLFRAAAQAQAETGAAMMVHIETGSSPELLADFLRERGVNLKKVYFCHMDRACTGRRSFQKVLEVGISLEFDTIGRFKYHSDQEEIRLMKQILEAGHEEQLLFSLDTTRTRLKAYAPDAVGLTYILKDFIPQMRSAGITDDQIQKIAVQNPRRILAW